MHVATKLRWKGSKNLNLIMSNLFYVDVNRSEYFSKQLQQNPFIRLLSLASVKKLNYTGG